MTVQLDHPFERALFELVLAAQDAANVWRGWDPLPVEIERLNEAIDRTVAEARRVFPR